MIKVHSFVLGLIVPLLFCITAEARSAGDTKLCADVMQRANEGTLHSLLLDKRGLAPPQTNFDNPVLFSGRLNINNSMGDEDLFVVGGKQYEQYETLYVFWPIPNREPTLLTTETAGDASSADHFELLEYSKKIYVLQRQHDEPRLLIEFEDSLETRIVCEFASESQPEGRKLVRVMSDYEIADKAAKSEDADIWEYVLLQPNFDQAESLLSHGHKVTDTIGPYPLLSWAVWQDKADVANWLLAHGAPINDNRGDSNPLREAIRSESPTMAIRLLRAGAAVGDAEVTDIADYAKRHPGDGELVILEAVKVLKRVPHKFMFNAVESPHPALLDNFVGSGFPVEMDCLDWHAGKMTTVPYIIAGAAYFASTPAMLKRLEKLYSRRTLSPTDQCANSRYGSFESGLSVSRYRRSDISDDHFLLFSTSICMQFLTDDCGPQALRRRASKWLEQLPQDCNPLYAKQLDSLACKLLSHYVAISEVTFDQAVLIHPVNAKFFQDGTRFTTARDLIEMYTKKNNSFSK